MPNQKVEISIWNVVKVIAVLAGIALLYYIRDIILLLFIVAIIVAALEPSVESMQLKKIPRALGVTIIYLLLLLIFAGVIYLVVPPFVNQIGELANSLPDYVNRYQSWITGTSLTSIWTWQSWLANVSSDLSKYSGGFFDAASNFFGGIVSFITVIVLSFYLLLEREAKSKALIHIIPPDRKEAILEVIRKISEKIGRWLRGQLTLCLIIGVLDFIALMIIGIPYALSIGILAAFLEMIPILGPVITGVFAIVIAITTVGWVKALIVLIVFILIQQLENQILVPKIMQKAVGLSPVYIIVALLIAAKLFGLIGIILAVPVAASIVVVIAEWQNLTKVIKNSN